MSDALHVPEGIRYDCVQCGRCCRAQWEIPVDTESEKRLAQYDLTALLPPELLGPYLIERKTEKADKVLLRHAGGCAFLAEDNLCRIHGAHGLASKPQACQDFPYRYVETPGGVFTGVSFACTAILANHGTPVGEQRPWLEQNRRASLMAFAELKPVRFTPERAISWDAYEELESQWRGILAQRQRPWRLRLAAINIHLDLLLRLFRAAQPQLSPHGLAIAEKEYFPADSGPASDRELVDSLRKRMQGNGDWAELFRITTATRPNPALQRAFLGLITAFRQTFLAVDQKPSRPRAIASVLRHYVSHAFRLGDVHLQPLGRPFPYAALRRIRLPAEEGSDTEELLTRYFDHMLFRKDLLLAESVWLGARLLQMLGALVTWHATGRASHDGSSVVLLDHLREGIRDVERVYVFHTRFGRFFRDMPMLGNFLDLILARPSFIGAMAGPAV